MILQRFSRALLKQDWMAVAIEFMLVIAGVLIALQVDRYNEQQLERAREVQYLRAMYQDLEQDMLDSEKLVETLSDVVAFGDSSIRIIESRECIESCWESLVQLFHASQWISTAMNTTTYEELKRYGWPSNKALKDQLNEYYNLDEARQVAVNSLPEYRRLVRSIIPIDVQKHLWKECFLASGRFQTYITACPKIVSEQRAQEIVSDIVRYPNIKTTLTFWMSNMSVSLSTLPSQKKMAEVLLNSLEEEINR